MENEIDDYEIEQEIEYGLYYDSTTDCIVQYTNGGQTFIEVCGKNRLKVSRLIRDLLDVWGEEEDCD